MPMLPLPPMRALAAPLALVWMLSACADHDPVVGEVDAAADAMEVDGAEVSEVDGAEVSEVDAADAARADVVEDAETDADADVSEVEDGAEAADNDVPAASPLTLSDVGVALLPDAPLVARLTATTSRPARLVVRLREPVSGRDELLPSAPAATTAHEVHLFALTPATTFAVDVHAVAADDAETPLLSLPLDVPALDASLPRFTVEAASPGDLAPGFTLVLPRASGTTAPRGQAFLLDPSGRPRWMFTAPAPLRDARLTPRGTLLSIGPGGLTERALTGAILRHVPKADLGADTLHHAVRELPDGHVVVLSTELRTIDGYPAETPGGPTQNVVGDVVLDIAPDGSVARTFRLLDLLDPHRIRDGFFTNEYDAVYPNAAPTRDWSHANALAYDPARDALIVTLRHQHLLVAISRATGALLWRLGADGDFALTAALPDTPLAPPPTGPDGWFYGPHGGDLTPAGHLLVFDNGFGRPLAEGGAWSRAVELALSPGAAPPSASIVGSWAGSAPAYAPTQGDVDLLDTGAALVTFGTLTQADGRRFARVLEVPRLTPEALPLWTLTVDHPTESYMVFQADRIPAFGAAGPP